MTPLSILRQSAAELLALSVIDLFPGALLVESVATELGFYCDFIATQPIDDHALSLIEEKMRAFIKQNIEVRALEMMREVAANYLTHHGQSIRAEIVRGVKENIVPIIQIGKFYDYCPPPYVSTTREVEFFKIFKVEKAIHYLHNEDPIEVKRIQGTVSTDKQSLKKWVKALSAGKKSNHVKLGRDFFSFQENVSHIAWTWEKNGAQLKDRLTDWWKKEHEQQGFLFLSTPSLIKESLLKKSGIDENTQAFLPVMEIDGDPYVIAPSTTPAHMAIFQQKQRSYQEMPIRFAEMAPVIFQEKPASLWGLFDSRLVSVDYAHIFCCPEHLEAELISSLQFIDKIIKMFGFESYWHLKGKRQDFASTVNRWEKVTKSFISAFEKAGLNYRESLESSFSGPVAEARLIDSFGREWNGPNIGLNLNAPKRFGLCYQGPDEKFHVPLMMTRSLFGSLERFAALLLEHTSGMLPKWLVSSDGL